MKKILVCDDDQDALYMTTFVLTDIGWEVSTSTDCNNILEKVHEFSPSVVIMDINIPEEGGIAATQILKKNSETKHIPVVLFSSSIDIISLAEEAGTNLYLSKPFEIKKLEAIVSLAYKEFMSGDPKANDN